MSNRTAAARRLAPAVLLAISVGGVAPAEAATITADSDSGCSLDEAIRSANANGNVGGCSGSGGYGADTIQLDYDVSLTVPAIGEFSHFGGPAGLPTVTTHITIVARDGDEIARAALACDSNEATAFRLFHILGPSANLTLVGLTLRNGCVAAPTGGAHAGAILMQGGTLALDGVTLEDNTARASDTAPSSERYAVGGAILVVAGTISSISDSIFDGNVARGGDSITTDPGGSAEGGALAAYNSATIGTISRSVFRDNHAQAGDGVGASNAGGRAFGGAIGVYATTAIGTIDRVEFSDNSAVGGNSLAGAGEFAHGGAVWLEQSTASTISRCAFDGNLAVGGDGVTSGGSAFGAALANEGTIATLADNTFTANIGSGGTSSAGSVSVYGGGLYNEGTITLVENNTWSGNTLYSFNGNTVNSILRGGGVMTFGELTTFRHNTLVGNVVSATTAPHGNFLYGAGFYNLSGFSSAFSNNLLADNVIFPPAAPPYARDCNNDATFASSGYNLVEAPGNCSFAAAGDVTGTDAAVGAAADNGCLAPLPDDSCPLTISYALTSPALDGGSCIVSGATDDARGIGRPKDFASVAGPADQCDIGAMELGEEVDLELGIAESADPVGLGVTSTLTYTVTLSNSGPLLVAATNAAVAVTLTLPADVTLTNVSPSVGSWNGTSWSVPSLAAGASATLTVTLAVGPNAASGTDTVTCAAAVTAVDQDERDAVLPSDSESTSVRGRAIFASGFEDGDPAFDDVEP